MTIHASRIVQFEGAANIRDLGGLPTSDGGSVRRGRIFRSDVLYRLTERDILELQTLGIRTVIDLRSRDEARLFPQSPIQAIGLQQFNVPIVTNSYSADGSLIEDYLLLLRNVGAGFREVFGHLANDAYPLLINCFAGKDRTGLTSALILAALGVPDDVIVADYALSEQHMFRHLNIHRSPDDDSAAPQFLPAWLEAAPATMEATLQAIAVEWGSVHGYLASIGIAADELRRIGETLIERVPEDEVEP